MTYSEWANWPISLSMPIVLIARRISVVRFRDVPLDKGRRRRRRNVLRACIWRGMGWGKGKRKGKDKGPKT